MKWPFWSHEPEVEPWPSVEDDNKPPIRRIDDLMTPHEEDIDFKGPWVATPKPEDPKFHDYGRKEEPIMAHAIKYDVTVSFTVDPSDPKSAVEKLEELSKHGSIKVKTRNIRAPKSAE